MLDLSNKKEEEKKGTSKPLITPKAIVTEETEKNVSIFVVICLIVILVLTAFFYVFKVYRDSQLKHNQAVYADLLTKLNTKEISEIDKTAQKLQKGLAVFQSYLGEQSDFSKLFQELQKGTPKDVKLNNFSVSDKDEVKLDGEASDYVAVAKAMASYAESAYFSNVTLVSSSSGSSQDGKVTFSLTMKLNKAQLK